MGKATITRIDSRSKSADSSYNQPAYATGKESDDEYDGSSGGDDATLGWAKLWKVIFISYIPATVLLEVFLVVLMNSWPTNSPAEAEYVRSVANGWVNIVSLQVLIPILSFFIRSLIGFFLKRRFSINLINRMSKSAIIPIMAVSLLMLFFLSTLFAYMNKNFNLFTMVTTGFLFISFYFSGIITTLSWVIFVLERDNPYEAST